MGHLHSVHDTDAHLKINAITRVITNASSGKTVLIQCDHNSERFTFEVPRIVDGHDLSKCNVAQIHYINIDSANKENTSTGVYEADDLQISPDSNDVVILSWLISGNATKYAGSLNFLVKFKCVDDSGEVVYIWNTAIYTGISVSSGIDNGEDVVEEYADVLERWRQELIDTGGVTDDRIEQAVANYMAENPDSGGNVDQNVMDILGDVINIADSESGESGGSGGSTTIPEQRISLDATMTVGKVMQQGNVDATDTNYMYTEKIKLNSEKSFQLIAVNLNGFTMHPALRYVTAYDADGNVISACSQQSIPEASVSVGRTIQMDNSVDSVIISIYKAFDYTDKTIILPAVEVEGSTTAIPEETIALDDAMSVGSYFNINGPDATQTYYKYTEKIKLNATKSFKLTGVNLNGVTVHPALRYIVAFGSDGSYLADYKMENVAEASVTAGRTITMDEAVDSVIITIYKADNYTDKTIVLLGREGTSGEPAEAYTTLKTEKLSGFDGMFSADEVCHGTHKNGIADFTDKRSICTIGFVKPFVTTAVVTSEDFKLAVAVYNNGAYVRTDAWFTKDSSYTFDHEKYQYKLYIMGTDEGYMHNFEAARESVKLKVSTPDILYAYNALESKRDAERERMSKAMESMMRRNYDIVYANAPEPNGLIAYTGNNQIVHPKVLYFPNKFGGHRYWMAYTPYPWANDPYENPCIAYSDDGYEWTNIDGNPLDDPNGDGYNSDTHLVYVESTGTLEVWYRYVGDYETMPVPEIIYRQTSTNGINWTTKEAVINNTSGDYVRYLSPAVVHDGGKYKMWVVNSSENTINYYEGANASGMTKVRDITLTYQGDGKSYTLWHIDVIEDNGKTVLLAMCKSGTTWSLFLSTSDDNVTFTTPELVMIGNPYGWDTRLYRSSIVNVNGEYRIYYTAQNEMQKYGMGISTSNTLSNFVGKW